MRLSTTLIALFLIVSFPGLSQEKTFAFKGKVHSYSEALKGALVEVYDAGDLVDETTTKGGGRFEFELPSERDYMIEISMENLRSKTIWISTRRTQDIDFKVPTFGFDVHLKKEKITRYDELSEIPVTFIKYQPKKKVFYMDKTYEDAVENKIEDIKKNSLRIR